MEKALSLSKKITYYIGAIAMFFIGAFYMFMSDLTFKNTSDSLIIAVLLSFGSAILFFLSASFNERPTVMYILKGVAIALAIGFIVYLHVFQGSEYYLNMLEKFRKAGIKGAKDLAASQATMIISFIVAYLSLVAQGASTTLEAVIKED